MPLQKDTTLMEQPEIVDFVPTQDPQEVKKEILRELLAEKKSIPSKFFYDSKGSALFEEITRLKEYYPTSSEKYIIRKDGKSIFREAKPGSITELGSGDASKISIALSRLAQNGQKQVRYQAVDISRSAVENSIEALKTTFPAIKTRGIIMDFTNHLDLLQPADDELFCFFGSTLGNFSRHEAVRFLCNLRNVMKPDNHLLLGLDMVKNRDILERAYNDASGITAAFNFNILNHINRIIQSDFRKQDFNHLAFYNDKKERIEMHLQAGHNIQVNSPHFDQTLNIHKGERILTEYSHKYSEKRIERMLNSAGFSLKKSYTDANGYFRLLLLVPSE